MIITEEPGPPQSMQLQLQEMPWDLLQTWQEEQGLEEQDEEREERMHQKTCFGVSFPPQLPRKPF